MDATFRVQLSTHEFCLHFCPFFLLVSAALSWVFALLLLPDGPKSRQVRRFFGGGGFSRPEMRLPRHIWAKRGGAQACYAPFLGGVLGSSVPRKNKKKQKEKKEEKKKILSLASRKRCDLKTRKRCDFFSAAQKIASDFSAIYSAIFWRFFCDFCGKTCDLVLFDLKTQRFFCDCDFLGR